MASDTKHTVNLPVCFLLLLVFTTAEIVLYEVWRRSGHEVDGQVTHFIPKFALVLLILVFTIPKAFIVLTYFMHLKFERVTVVGIALLPFVFVAVLILPILTDIRTLAPRNYSKSFELGDFATHTHGGDAPAKAEDHEAKD